MKVCLAIPYNPLVEVGGLEIGTLYLAKNLIKNGIDAEILTIGTSGQKEGTPVMGFSSLSQLCQYLVCHYEELDVVHWLEIFPNVGEIDIQAMTSGILRSLGKKVILMVATSGNLKSRGTGELITPLIKYCFDDYVISNDDQILEFRDVGINLTGRNAIGFGVDTMEVFKPIEVSEKIRLRNQLGLPQDKVLCLFLGRFVERKCPDFLLKSWSTLKDIYSQSELVVVGSGMQQHDSIESDIVKLAEAAEGVNFRDITDCPSQYYQACDIFLLPSSREGQPNVLLESMACSNAVIGSDIAGIRELLINGFNGLTFKTKDKKSFTDAIRLLVRNKELRLDYGRVARSMISAEKDWSVVTKKYLDLYNQNRKE